MKKRASSMQFEDLAKRTRQELLALAKQHGIKGVSRLRKKELADRLLQALSLHPQSVSSPTPPQLHSATPIELATTANPPASSSALSVSTEAVEQSRRPEHSSDSPSPALLTDDSPQESPLTPSAAPPAVDLEQAAADSKFFLGPQPPAAVLEPDVLPASYDDNRIVLLARDPYWLYVYWDFNGERWTQAQNQRDAEDDRLVLRVFDVTYMEFNGANAWSSTDVELTPFATSWCISVPQADAAYCAEIGYRSHTGRFTSFGRSNIITTPRAEVSPITKVRWFTPPERRDASSPSKAPFPSEAFSWTSDQTSTIQSLAPSSADRCFSWSAWRKR